MSLNIVLYAIAYTLQKRDQFEGWCVSGRFQYIYKKRERERARPRERERVRSCHKILYDAACIGRSVNRARKPRDREKHKGARIRGERREPGGRAMWSKEIPGKWKEREILAGRRETRSSLKFVEAVVAPRSGRKRK